MKNKTQETEEQEQKTESPRICPLFGNRKETRKKKKPYDFDWKYIKMTNLFQKAVLGTALLVSLVGCANDKIENLVGRSLNSEKTIQIYTSPVVRPEQFLEIVSRIGNVDETKPVFEKDGFLYVVGFGQPRYTESYAKADASINAINKMNELTDMFNLKGFRCTNWETIKIRDKTKGDLYINEALCRIPSNNLPYKEISKGKT